MASLAELAQQHTTLRSEDIEQLLRLTTSWSLLADLSFSDMVLMAPHAEGEEAEDFIVLAQMRPNNRATLLAEDLVGTIQPGA